MLFPKNQAAITPKITCTDKTFYVNRGSPCIVVNCWQCWKTVIWQLRSRQSGVRTSRQAYGIATSSALPEEWQKAEYDLKVAKEAYDAQQKMYDSRKALFEQGALPRKDYDQSIVALTQAKAATRSLKST